MKAHDKNEKESVAIIGAGYAGLTLANCLKQQSTTLFDRLAPPREGVLVGKIRVPIARLLCEKMGWSLPVSDDEVEEEWLLSKLRNKRVNEMIQYHSSVSAIVFESESGYFLSVHNRKINALTREGPFQRVVVASGMRTSRNFRKHAIVVGDAASTLDVFGLNRINSGAHRAISQAMALASELENDNPDLSRFQVSRLISVRRWLFMLAILVLAVLVDRMDWLQIPVFFK